MSRDLGEILSGIYAVQHSEGGLFFAKEKKSEPPQGCGARIGVCAGRVT
jgi:hypothetical protein